MLMDQTYASRSSLRSSNIYDQRSSDQKVNNRSLICFYSVGLAWEGVVG